MESAAIGFVALLALILLGVPVAFSMIFVGMVGFGFVAGWQPSFISTSRTITDTVGDYSLTVVPLFILMGNFISRAGLSEDLYNASYAWIGHRRGGLARATILSCAGFSAVCGSSLATTATMSRIAVPAMRRFGYDEGLAAGSVAAGGTLGILIPPSVIMVLYGIMTTTDIGKLFIAGVLPGILGIALYNLSIDMVTRLRPDYGPPGERTTWPGRFAALATVWEIVLLFLMVIGGIYLGVFTPTEAAGIGALGAMLSAIVRRRVDVRALGAILFESVRTTIAIFAVLVGAMIFASFLNMTAMPKMLGDVVTGAGLDPILIILSMVGVYIVLGCILDSISMILLTLPLFFPIVQQAGFDPIWFGIIIVVVTEISLITPPIGMNVFVLSSTVPEVPISSIFRGVMPFIAADVARLALLLAFPWISLVLPSLMS